jgi:hypothetical protein
METKTPYLDPAWYARARSTPGAARDFTVHDYIPGQPIPTWVKDPETGLIVVNELKRYVKPYTLTTDVASITLAAGALSEPIPMVIDGKGHFEIFDAFFVSQRAEGFTVELFDPGNLGQERPLLMNREVHVATIASGDGITLPLTGALPVSSSPGRPFRWPQSFFMNVADGGGMIVARFRNLNTTQTNVIRFNLVGRRWYHLQAPWKVANRMAEIFREQARTFPYFFTTDQFVELTALGTSSPVIRFGDDAYVEWVKGMSSSTGRYTVRIVETATGKRLMEQPSEDRMVFGNGELPMLNWENSLFEPNYQLTLELTDLSNATNTVWITLGCRKIKVDPKELELLRPGTSPGRA